MRPIRLPWPRRRITAVLAISAIAASTVAASGTYSADAAGAATATSIVDGRQATSSSAVGTADFRGSAGNRFDFGPDGVSGAAPPTLSWADCGGGFQCATADVPLDYRRPRGALIQLAVIRLPAVDPARRIGSLFLNFGGPGSDGVGHLRRLGPNYPLELRQRFDLVSFDPRGISRSTAVRCFASQAEQQRFFDQLPTFPETPRDQPAFFAKNADLGRRCADRAGSLLAHLSSANVARDLELLRRAVGDARLSYLGYSYGTYLGAVYANLFPDRVRAMTFDSTLDLVANATGAGGDANKPVDVRADTARSQYIEFEAFLSLCAKATGRCAFGAGDPKSKFDELADTVRRSPIVLADPDGTTTRYTYEKLIATIAGYLYASSDWPGLGTLLQRLSDASHGVSPSPARESANTRDQEQYLNNSAEAYAAIQCVDSDSPHDEQTYRDLAVTEDRRVPYFGLSAVFDLAPCIRWPATDPDRYLGPWNNPTPEPILVVNNRYDPATPLWNARAAVRQLASAELLTVNGYGHTTLDVPSACASAAISRDLVDGVLPAAGTQCPPDQPPFT